MQPDIILNPLAIGVAIIINVVIGSLWYGPVFGEAWGKEIDPFGTWKPKSKANIKAMVLMVIGSLFTAFVLAHTTQIWRPSVWERGLDDPSILYALAAAFFTWIGFYVPTELNLVGFEERSWKLFAINSGYQFVSLLAMALVLSYWR